MSDAPDWGVLVVTDIVDSTALGERWAADQTSSLWLAHDEAARRLIHAHQGLEIGRSDGMLALFPALPQALGFVADYHARMRELAPPMCARATVHAGPV